MGAKISRNRDKNTIILHFVLIIEKKNTKNKDIFPTKGISFYQQNGRNKTHNDNIYNQCIAFLQNILIFAYVFKNRKIYKT